MFGRKTDLITKIYARFEIRTLDAKKKFTKLTFCSISKM